MSIIFDTGPIISLAMNNLLGVLEELKKKYNKDFLISKSVRKELIDRPLHTKKFKFEALQVLKLIKDNVLGVVESKEVEDKAVKLLSLANSIFTAYGKNINIVHKAEITGIELCINLNADAFVVDERTSRLLLENPIDLKNILEKKLHTNISINNENLKQFKEQTKGVKPIRSVELVTVAYELGLLDKFILDIEEPRKNLIDSLLWGVKLNGCAVSKQEIDEIMQLVK